MHPIPFPQANVQFGASQPEYLPLPAHRTLDEKGTVLTCWQLDTADIDRILKTKCIWLSQLTFRDNLQPIMLSTRNPFTDEPERTPVQKEFIAKVQQATGIQLDDNESKRDSLDWTPHMVCLEALGDLEGKWNDNPPSKAVLLFLWDENGYDTAFRNAGMKCSEVIALLEVTKEKMLELMRPNDKGHQF